MKIGVLIDSEHAVRAWVESKNFQKLTTIKNIETVLIVAQNIVDHPSIKMLIENKKDEIIKIVEIKKYPRFFQSLFFGLLVHNKKKSISFKTRIDRFMYGFCEVDKNKIYFIKTYILNYKQAIVYIPVINLMIDRVAKYIFMYWNPIKENISSYKLDYLLFSSSTFEFHQQSLIHLMKKNKVKTIMSIDNWDNISSKTILKIKPDYMTVLGPQAKRAAIDIQGMEEAKVLSIGTPRFDEYRVPISRSIETIQEVQGKKMLYLGSALPHAERALLYELMSKYKTFFNSNNIDIYYKAHPSAFERCQDLRVETIESIGVKIYGSKNLDSDLKNHKYLFENMNGKFKMMFNNFDYIIATPTTAALESLLCSRPTIIDATNDNIHNSTAALSLLKYEHFKEFKEIKMLNFALNVQDIYRYANEFVSSDINNIQYDVSDIVHLDKLFFIERLLSKILP